MKHLKFLLATDFSEAVMNAERYAVQLAKETGSILRILHVYPIPISFPTELMDYAGNSGELEKTQSEYLEKHRRELFDSMHLTAEDVPFECVVREGNNVGKQIREEAEGCHADFIIVGTHGVSGFRETFFGSHSWNVIRKSSVPVFAIPKDALFTGIKKIVLGTSYREEEFHVMDLLVQLAKKFEAELTVLHITNYVASKEFEQEMFEKFRTEVQGKFPYSRLEVRLLVNEAIVEALNLYCSDTKTDILAISIPKMSLFESIISPGLSITKEMSFNTHTPFLAVPVSYATAENIGMIAEASIGVKEHNL